MPSMIRRKESVEKHLMQVERHMRLCRQNPGTEKYAYAIKPFYTKVDETNKLYRDETYNRAYARDIMTLCNHQLEDGLRTAYERCRQHDRENPYNKVLHLIFPDETFGNLVRNNIFKETVVAEQLVLRLEHLGTDHPLFPVTGYLRKLIRSMEKAIEEFRESTRLEKIAQVKLELTKEKLRKQYEANYLDARKELGRKTASNLFPYRSHKRKREETVPEVTISKIVKAA